MLRAGMVAEELGHAGRSECDMTILRRFIEWMMSEFPAPVDACVLAQTAVSDTPF